MVGKVLVSWEEQYQERASLAHLDALEELAFIGVGRRQELKILS